MNSQYRKIKVAIDEHPTAQLYREDTIVNPDMPSEDTWYTQLVTLFVYPEPGIYHLDQLQQFIEELADMSQSSLQYQTRGGSCPGYMSFPLMHMDEVIGKQYCDMKPYLHIPDLDVELPSSFWYGTRNFTTTTVHQADLWRRVLLHVYPDRAYAERAANGTDVSCTNLVTTNGVAYHTT